MASCSVFLPWRISINHLGRIQFRGSQRAGHDCCGSYCAFSIHLDDLSRLPFSSSRSANNLIFSLLTLPVTITRPCLYLYNSQSLSSVALLFSHWTPSPSVSPLQQFLHATGISVLSVSPVYNLNLYFYPPFCWSVVHHLYAALHFSLTLFMLFFPTHPLTKT